MSDLPACDLRLATNTDGFFYCRHANVRAAGSIVNASVCRSCRSRLLPCDDPRAVPESTPDASDRTPPSIVTKKPSGTGTELKKLLAKFWIKPGVSGGCPCEGHAAEMDRNGPDWCEANLETIVGWLEEEARKRKLPFSWSVGRMLVRRAIKNARTNSTRALSLQG